MEHLGNFACFLGLCIMDGCLLTLSVPFSKFPLFLSNKEGKKVDNCQKSTFFGFYGIFQIFPENLPRAKLTHTKDELFQPNQA